MVPSDFDVASVDDSHERLVCIGFGEVAQADVAHAIHARSAQVLGAEEERPRLSYGTKIGGEHHDLVPLRKRDTLGLHDLQGSGDRCLQADRLEELVDLGDVAIVARLAADEGHRLAISCDGFISVEQEDFVLKTVTLVLVGAAKRRRRRVREPAYAEQHREDHIRCDRVSESMRLENRFHDVPTIDRAKWLGRRVRGPDSTSRP